VFQLKRETFTVKADFHIKITGTAFDSWYMSFRFSLSGNNYVDYGTQQLSLFTLSKRVELVEVSVLHPTVVAKNILLITYLKRKINAQKRMLKV